MPYGHRLSHIAAKGFLIILFSTSALAQGESPTHMGSKRSAEEQRRSPGEPTPSIFIPWPSPPAITEPAEYRPDCSRPKDHDEADLCQQRRMAEAAEDQSFWVQVQFWLGILTLGGLGLTMYYSKQNAEAAIAAAQIAEKALEVTATMAKRQLRAFVFGKGFTSGLDIWNDTIRSYVIFVEFENAGQTPAVDMQLWVNFQACPVGQADQLVFIPVFTGPGTVLGPHASLQSGWITIPIETMLKKWRGEIDILVYSKIVYRDTFDADLIHHHEQCSSINIIHDPRDIPPEGHPPYIQFVTHVKQNSTA